MQPITFPFSVLDYGLTALALLCMVGIVYLFIRALNAQREEQMKLLKQLVTEVERHTEISRAMMNEFFNGVQELVELRREFYAARTEMRQRVNDLQMKSRARFDHQEEVNEGVRRRLDDPGEVSRG